jgi:hypothetical protein
VTDIAHSERKASLELLRELRLKAHEARREQRKLRIAFRGRPDLLARLEAAAKDGRKQIRLIRSLIRQFYPDDKPRPITLPESPHKFAVEEATGPPRLAADKRQRRSATGAPKSAPKGDVVSSDKPSLATNQLSVEPAEAATDLGWFDANPTRRYRVRGNWAIRRRGKDVFLRTPITSAPRYATDSEAGAEAVWWVSAYPHLSPEVRATMAKSAQTKRGPATLVTGPNYDPAKQRPGILQKELPQWQRLERGSS